MDPSFRAVIYWIDKAIIIAFNQRWFNPGIKQFIDSNSVHVVPIPVRIVPKHRGYIHDDTTVR